MKKQCPMKFCQPVGGSQDCCEEKCAWWNIFQEECALLAITLKEFEKERSEYLAEKAAV